MKKDVNIRVANPSGNITIYVMDRFARSEYAAVARGLLAREELEGEQVAFVTGPNSMEMCGLEFCGNASRAFAYMISETPAHDTAQPFTVTVDVSGTDKPVDVLVDHKAGLARVTMPPHVSATPWGAPRGTLVDLGGIMHLVLEEVAPSDELFYRLRDEIAAEYDPPGIGVMFCCGEQVTPIVYVRDVDSVYHEGSCCSGCASVAIARSLGRPDGSYTYELKQPAGTLFASAAVAGGNVTGLWIDGIVTLSDPQTVTVEV